MLFRLKNGVVDRVNEESFKLEKDIQKLVEENMEKLLNLEFVISEFSVSNFRIDSLAYDIENNAFIIVEYKRGRSESLVDQGYTYLNILFDRRADFILKYNEVKNKNLKINDIDWEQSRVIFISPKFTDYQIKANDYKNNPIELIQISKYDGGIIELDRIKKNSNIKNETNNLKDNTTMSSVDKIVKVYSEEDHLNKVSDEVKEVYEKLRDRLIEWDGVEVVCTKVYIAFKYKSNIVDVIPQNKYLKLHINLKINEIDDPRNIVRDVSNVGHLGNGDCEVKINVNSDFEYILSLIRQSWEKNGNS